MKTYHIEIEGMGCAHCVRGVEEALSAIGAQVNNCAIGCADVRFDGAVDALRDRCGGDTSLSACPAA